MHIDNLLARFAEVSPQRDGGYIARCPDHDDSNPSLRIWVGEDRKVRMTCRAGCDTDGIRVAAGLNWGDLFNVSGDVDTVPQEPPSPAGPDELDMLAMYVSDTRSALHFEPADGAAGTYLASRFGLSPEGAYELGIGFAPAGRNTFPFAGAAFTRHPRVTVPLRDFDGVARGLQGRDISGGCPARWVSLSNPEGQAWQRWGYLSAGTSEAAERPVIVAEGPSDGLTAVALGYDVVLIRGAALAGSQSVLEALAQGLAGRQVIAAGDSDSAGEAFNRRLADGLRPYGFEVASLDIPQRGWDLAEWRKEVVKIGGDFGTAFHQAVRQASPALAPKEVSTVAVLADADIIPETEALRIADTVKGMAKIHGWTDAMRAHALVQAFDGQIRYATGLGYHVWNGTVWEADATKVRQAIHYMGAALKKAGREDDAIDFGTTRKIDYLLKELPAVPGVAVSADDFDCQRHLLSFRNGTVDLRSGELRPHSKEDMITAFIPLDYEADAACPRWESFLAEIFPGHPDLVSYMQRLCGYGITGSTDEQCFAVLWGGGSNGKSVLTDTLTSVFEPMVTTTPFATFEAKSGGGIPNDLAALRGARLVMASEGESGKPMSESVLKRLTGKDRVTARFLNREFFTYSPTFLIMLATNHKPSFRGQDEGLWRRVKLVPFTRYFAPHERDYDLTDKLLEEAPGIIAWAVRGAVAWYAGGLADPEEITSATREYKATSDALSGFYSDDPEDIAVLVASPGSVMLGSDAFSDYLEWCEAENLPPKERWTKRTFFAAMEERGAVKKRVSAGMALAGVARAKVRDSAHDDDPEIFG